MRSCCVNVHTCPGDTSPMGFVRSAYTKIQLVRVVARRRLTKEETVTRRRLRRAYIDHLASSPT
jgi:hypothetical protein